MGTPTEVDETAVKARIAGMKDVEGWQHVWPVKLPPGYDYATGEELDQREPVAWDVKGWTCQSQPAWDPQASDDPITSDRSLVAAGMTRFYLTGDEVPDYGQEGTPGYPSWKH